MTFWLQESKLKYQKRAKNVLKTCDCCSFYLVKTHQVHLTAYVDPLGADAEDAGPLQAPLSVHDTSRHGRW